MANPFDGLTPLEIFRKIAFELKGFGDEIVTGQIDMADALFESEAYGDQQNMFLALMAAHLMTIPGGIAASSVSGSAPAGVKSIKEGDLQITYQDNASANGESFKAWLNDSRFGILLLQMRRQLGMGFGLTAGTGMREPGPNGYYFPNRAIH